MADPWWAVARSEEVTSAKPINVDIGDQPVVLWRDHEGMPRALEDRCPHRRTPLSLGCVLGNGMIQCGYHGWTYDGATGHLKDIPNLKSTVKFPPIYRAAAFGVAESGGFVRVCLDAKSAAPEPASVTLPLSGSVDVALDHEHFIAALFDNPGLVMAIRGVRFTPYLMAELAEQKGKLVLERSCQWAGPRWPSPFSSDFPITLRIATDPVTGECDLLLRDDAFHPLLQATLAPVPAARGVTQVRWRARLAERRPGLRAGLMGLAAGSPFTIRPSIDGAALRVLKPSASIHAAALRETIASAQPQAGAT
ncbi:Rieske (2Fe-2S) protein [Novosphingobium sp. AAP93]|uniref:Rieske (2Fe-2S) protein n=1 Tax=Novosphingobium sp. AAP93 TaxID=1523427 RepID=UPI0006B9C4C7|nr:Rieske (2Fe-2S) protein [Novosphingobium sp. AAP93]KPF84116.1 (2Fe-2S)-binding protein [Novosphingobium sp. AAP93]